MDCLLGMANSILKSLKFTAVLQEDNSSGKDPMLDFPTWADRVPDNSGELGYRCRVTHILSKALLKQTGNNVQVCNA